jgi:hypothetical protein
MTSMEVFIKKNNNSEFRTISYLVDKGLSEPIHIVTCLDKNDVYLCSVIYDQTGHFIRQLFYVPV